MKFVWISIIDISFVINGSEMICFLSLLIIFAGKLKAIDNLLGALKQLTLQ